MTERARPALRRKTIGSEMWRIADWARRAVGRCADRGETARLYLHPCGDLLLYRDDDHSPLPDRMLVGVYRSTEGTDIRGDIEVALVDLEDMGVAA